jgi:hypothetical protein
MKPYLPITLAAMLTAGCASFDLPPLPQLGTQTPPNAPMTPVTAVRDFDDIVVPGGLVYQHTRSTVIESPVARSARLIYVGTLPVETLRERMRTGLEGNAWRHVTSSTSPELGSMQLYEKDGSSLQVVVREINAPYTELHLIVSRAVGRAAGEAFPAAARTR